VSLARSMLGGKATHPFCAQLARGCATTILAASFLTSHVHWRRWTKLLTYSPSKSLLCEFKRHWHLADSQRTHALGQSGTSCRVALDKHGINIWLPCSLASAWEARLLPWCCHSKEGLKLCAQWCIVQGSAMTDMQGYAMTDVPLARHPNSVAL